MRRWLKVTFFAIAVTVLLVVAAGLVVTRTSFVSRRAVNYLDEALTRRTNLRLSVEELGGNLLHELVADGVVITAGAPEHPDTLVEIARVTVRYDLRELLQAPYTVREITITDPRFRMPRDSLRAFAESLIWPAEGRSGPPPDFVLASLALENGTLARVGDALLLAEDICLRASVERTDGRITIDIKDAVAQHAGLGNLTVAGRLALEGGNLTVDSISLVTPRSQIALSGSPALWRVRAAPLDLADISAFTSIGLEARMNFDGTIKPLERWSHWRFEGEFGGAVAGIGITGVDAAFTLGPSGIVCERIAGRVAGTRWRGAGGLDLTARPREWSFDGQIAGFDLARYAPGTFPSDLSGSVHIAGVGTTAEALIIHADVRLGAGHFDHYPFDSAAGRLVATVDSITFARDFHLRMRQTDFRAGGTIVYADSLDLLVNMECHDLRAWDDVVFLDSLAGRAHGYLYLSGLTPDPDLSGVIISDSLRMFDLSTGDFHGRLYVPRFLHDRTGTVDAHWGASSTWGVMTDSIDLRARLSGQVVDIDWVRWSSPYAVVEGAGRLDWSADTLPVFLHPLKVVWEGQEYSGVDTVRIVIDSSGFVFHALEFAGPLGVLAMDGTMGFDETMNLDVDIGRFRLQALWRRFFPDIPLAGVVAMKGRLAGTMASPRFSLEGRVDGLRYDDRAFGDLEFELRYADRLLAVDRARLENPDFHADVSGTLPIDLSFTTVAQRILDLPLEGRLAAAGEVLDRIAAFRPDLLQSIRGPFAISAAISGTVRAPLLSGEAHLRAGTIKVLEIQNPLEDVGIDLSLRQDTIVITRAVGTVRDKKHEGTVNAAGTIRIVTYDRFDYDLTLKGNDVPVSFEFEDFALRTDFDLAVTGSTPPRVTGRVTPKRVDDRVPFSEEDEAQVEDTTLWDWELSIDMPSNYWIHNDQIETEMSAVLQLIRERGLVRIIGTAEIIRGKVYLWDKVGRITRGEIIFDDPDKPDPRLDLDVVFRIQQPRITDAGPGASSEVVLLKLHVGGRASEPTVEPEPPYTTQDAMLLLTANVTGTTTGDPLGSRVRFAAEGLLFSELQRLMARKLGVETLEIESGVDPGDTRMLVGHYLSPHFYLYGSRSIAAGGQEVGFEYRLSRRLFVEGIRDRNTFYRLNLHLNWDY